MAGLPHVTSDLVEYLENICPDQSPSLSTTERLIWFNAGKADLVRHLRSILVEQSQNILEGN
jgi:thiamine phosphate synthase YjbQ (UPF0047 family)